MAPSKVPLGTLHFVEQTVYKAEKALIAAKFNGIVLKTQRFDAQKDSQNPEFLSKNPTGKVPFLETEAGVVFTSNAIARYVARCRADTALYGKSFDDEGKIDTWLEFGTHEVEVPLMTWVYPVLGLLEDMPKVTADAQADVKKALAVLEERLKVSAYLVGDYVSLADIALVCALKEGFARVFDPAFRKPYPKVSAWFETCLGLPQFKSVLGEVKLCTQAEKPKPFVPPARAAAPAAAPAKTQADEAKQAEPKPAAKAPAQPAAKAPAAPAAPSAASPASGGALDDKIKAVGDAIRILKEKLKAEGLSGKKINDHDEVKKLVAQLQELKQQAEAAPAAAAPPPPAPAPSPAPAAPAPAADGGDLDAQVKTVGDEIRILKEKLKAEGLSGKKINDHDEVKRLVGVLQELKAKQAA